MNTHKATTIILRLQNYLDSDQKQQFLSDIADVRLHNLIIGNHELEQMVHNLCLRALRKWVA